MVLFVDLFRGSNISGAKLNLVHLEVY